MCGEFTGTGELQRASNAEMFPFDGVIMENDDAIAAILTEGRVSNANACDW